jgi:hypothetical protein
VKRARELAVVLANRGIMTYGDVDKFVDKVAADPLTVFKVAEHVAKSARPAPLGRGVSTDKAATTTEPINPILALVKFGTTDVSRIQNSNVEDLVD